MGNCLCFKSQPRKKIVLLLLGLDNSGKTAIAKRLAGDTVKQYDTVPTVGFSVVHLKYRKCDIHLYDLGGGAQIRGIWQSYFSDAHGIIFVVDASDYSRLIDSKQILYEILSNEKLCGKPMLVLANKQDVPGALDELDIVEKLKIEPLVNQQRCPTLVKSCCTITGDKLDTAIHTGYVWLLNLILRDYWKLNARVELDLREQHNQKLMIRSELLKRLQQDNSESNIGGGGDTIINITKSNNWISDHEDDEQNKIEVNNRRKIFAKRSNKTAPATMINTRNATNITRPKLKSALVNRHPLVLDVIELNNTTQSNGVVPFNAFTVKSSSNTFISEEFHNGPHETVALINSVPISNYESNYNQS